MGSGKSRINKRPYNSARAQHYATMMVAGRWTLSESSIVFSVKNILMNGMHRLSAITIAKVPALMTFLFKCEEEAFINMDTGLKRSGPDAFAIASVPNAKEAAIACRYLIGEEGAKVVKYAVSNDTLLQFYENSLDSARLQNLINMMRRAEAALPRENRKFLSSLLIGVLYRCTEGFTLKEAQHFVDEIGKPKGALILTYRTIAAASGGNVERPIKIACFILAWNAWNANGGKKLLKEELLWKGEDVFPFHKPA
jgi:hypothetical protein